MKKRHLILAGFTIALIFLGEWSGFGGAAVALPTPLVSAATPPVSTEVRQEPQLSPPLPAQQESRSADSDHPLPPDPPQIPAQPPVVVNLPSPELTPSSTTIIASAIDPAIAALVNSVSTQQLSVSVQTLEGFGTRHSLSETGRPDFGVGAARNWIFDEFQRVGAGRLQVRFQDFDMHFNGLASLQRNVIATLPGIGPHPGVIALIAHYDSRNLDPADPFSLAPGADDNASGVALLLEAARLLSSRSWNQTIIFIASAAEELGTYGSHYYVQAALLDGMQFDMVVNNDIVGGHPGIPRSIRLFAPGPDNSTSSAIARYVAYVGRLYAPDFPVDIRPALDREGRWGDQREFINAGIGAVRLTESVEDPTAQHNSRDTAEKIDYDYLAAVTALNIAAAAGFAAAPATPLPPTITPTTDPGAFTITWLADPTPAGYTVPTENAVTAGLAVPAGYALCIREVGSVLYPAFLYLSAAEAGRYTITGLDAGKRYYLSLAALDASSHLGFFSPELLIVPADRTP